MKFPFFELFLLFLLVFGCTQAKTDSEKNSSCGLKDCNFDSNAPEQRLQPKQEALEINMGVFTDKSEYGSHQLAIIIVDANASERVEKAVVKIWGIKPYDRSFIVDEKQLDLQQGNNRIVFTETTPYCTAGCGGVYPGPYDINASVEIGGKEIAVAHATITLVKS